MTMCDFCLILTALEGVCPGRGRRCCQNLRYISGNPPRLTRDTFPYGTYAPPSPVVEHAHFAENT